MKLKQLMYGFLIVCLFTCCEQNDINNEIERLQSIEKELINSISQNYIEHAKVSFIIMKWE